MKRTGIVLTIMVAALCTSITAAPTETERLHQFFGAEWEWNLKDDPVGSSYQGDLRWNDQWEDLSLGAFQRREAHLREALQTLETIDRTKLSPADQINYDLFQKDTATSLEEMRFRPWLLPINQRSGPHTRFQLSDQLRFESVKDYQDWIARMNAYPVLIDQTLALMKEGVRTKILWPKVVMERVVPGLKAQIVDTPEESDWYGPFRKFPDSISAADQKRLAAHGAEAIAKHIVPSTRRLHDYFVDTYLPASFDRIGVWQMPDGDAFYAFRTRRFTTTNLTPAEIHRKGLEEVARIRAEMEQIKTKVGFKGTLQEFFQKLRTDPQFYYKTPEELFQAYEALCKRIDPNIIKIVKTHPRVPYGVVKIPDAIAPYTTTAYYNDASADGRRPGLYFVNLYRPEVRPKYEMMALSLHEAVPGHHLQISIAQELGEIPNFRRYGGYTAFIEGWGLYAESLGEDMGLYDDPYSKFGQLTYEMWRAVRLVVDTGMHSMKWDRQKAIDYFLDNAAKTEVDVINEIDRYITTPGQALAYKIGELKLKELRARAHKALGDKFDIRLFHDVVLGSGAVPLDMLEKNVDAWIAAQK